MQNNLARTGEISGSVKNIIGNTKADLVLEALGKIYIKTGSKTKLLNDVFKLLDSLNTQPNIKESTIITNDIDSLSKYPGDGMLIFDVNKKALYIAYDNMYLLVTDDIKFSGDESGYVKKSGDSMSGQLTIKYRGAPLIVYSKEQVDNLNANYLQGYSAGEIAKKNEKENITAAWEFEQNISFDKNVDIKDNIQVRNNATVGNDVLVGGNAFIEGSANIKGNANIDENANIHGDLILDGNMGSRKFASGYNGYGWRFDAETQTLTVDYLVVRKAMQVFELIVNKISATNGSLWVTDSVKVKSVKSIAWLRADESAVSSNTEQLLPETDSDAIFATNEWYVSKYYAYYTDVMRSYPYVISRKISDSNKVSITLDSTRNNFASVNGPCLFEVPEGNFVKDSIVQHHLYNKYYEGGELYVIEIEGSPTFESGDLIRCQKFEDNNIKYYDAIVLNDYEQEVYIIQVAGSVFDKYTEISYDAAGNIEKLEVKTNTSQYGDISLATVESDDGLVRIGNIYDTTRQNSVFITSSEFDSPYVQTMSGVNRPDYSVLYRQPLFKQYKEIAGEIVTTDISNTSTNIRYYDTVKQTYLENPTIDCEIEQDEKGNLLSTYNLPVKARFGNLSGINDDAFGNKQPYGYGLYADNVFLKGEFVLNNGQTVVEFTDSYIKQEAEKIYNKASEIAMEASVNAPIVMDIFKSPQKASDWKSEDMQITESTFIDSEGVLDVSGFDGCKAYIQSQISISVKKGDSLQLVGGIGHHSQDSAGPSWENTNNSDDNVQMLLCKPNSEFSTLSSSININTYITFDENTVFTIQEDYNGPVLLFITILGQQDTKTSFSLEKINILYTKSMSNVVSKLMLDSEGIRLSVEDEVSKLNSSISALPGKISQSVKSEYTSAGLDLRVEENKKSYIDVYGNQFTIYDSDAKVDKLLWVDEFGLHVNGTIEQIVDPLYITNQHYTDGSTYSGKLIGYDKIIELNTNLYTYIPEQIVYDTNYSIINRIQFGQHYVLNLYEDGSFTVTSNPTNTTSGRTTYFTYSVDKNGNIINFEYKSDSKYYMVDCTDFSNFVQGLIDDNLFKLIDGNQDEMGYITGFDLTYVENSFILDVYGTSWIIQDSIGGFKLIKQRYKYSGSYLPTSTYYQFITKIFENTKIPILLTYYNNNSGLSVYYGEVSIDSSNKEITVAVNSRQYVYQYDYSEMYNPKLTFNNETIEYGRDNSESVSMSHWIKTGTGWEISQRAPKEIIDKDYSIMVISTQQTNTTGNEETTILEKGVNIHLHKLSNYNIIEDDTLFFSPTNTIQYSLTTLLLPNKKSQLKNTEGISSTQSRIELTISNNTSDWVFVYPGQEIMAIGYADWAVDYVADVTRTRMTAKSFPTSGILLGVGEDLCLTAVLKDDDSISWKITNSEESRSIIYHPLLTELTQTTSGTIGKIQIQNNPNPSYKINSLYVYQGGLPLDVSFSSEGAIKDIQLTAYTSGSNESYQISSTNKLYYGSNVAAQLVYEDDISAYYINKLSPYKNTQILVYGNGANIASSENGHPTFYIPSVVKDLFTIFGFKATQQTQIIPYYF